MWKKYIIEREIEGVGNFTETELGNAAVRSNAAVAKLDGLQWQFSFVAQNKTFCVYLAKSEEAIRAHAQISGFPASKVTEIKMMFDPSSEQKADVAHAA